MKHSVYYYVSDDTTYFAKTLRDFLNILNLNQVISKRTRIAENSETLIDIIATNHPEHIAFSDVIIDGTSDHNVTYCTRKLKSISALLVEIPLSDRMSIFKILNLNKILIKSHGLASKLMTKLMTHGHIGVHFFLMYVTSMRRCVSGVLEVAQIWSGFEMTSTYQLVIREIIGKRSMQNTRHLEIGRLTLSGEIKQIIWPHF